jgi:hypothetical protein
MMPVGLTVVVASVCFALSVGRFVKRDLDGAKCAHARTIQQQTMNAMHEAPQHCRVCN